MKRLFSISILVLWMNLGFAQENTNWVDSILTAIILNEIEVFDNNFNVIENAKIKFVTNDTVVNDQWTRPKYIDNVLQGSFDGVIIENPILFDTSTNLENNQYLDFKFPKYDTDGNYLTDTIAFIIKKNNNRKEILTSSHFDNLINTVWKIDKILKEGKEIELDSCHKIFTLIINGDYTFLQQFGENQYDCSIKSMKQNKEVGIEGDSDDFMEYHNKIQGHYLSINKGIWKIDKNNIQLIDLNKKRTLLLKIKKSIKEKVYLSLDQLDYKIMLKKASRL